MDGPEAEFDVIIAGGGLAGGLIALRLAARRPELRVLVLESGPVLGGVHTWCCFETDLPPDIRRWITPLLSHRWGQYQVRFPGHSRSLTTPYLSIASGHFAEVVGRPWVNGSGQGRRWPTSVMTVWCSPISGS